MVKVSFTICSNNYLAQAKVLGDSLIVHNPDYTFIICLVDRLSDQIDYAYFAPHEIVCIEDVPIANFEEMILKYDITELNTAVKPFFFRFLFNRSLEIKNIIYLDPDIIIYDQFIDIENGYIENTFIITPHITNAINDNLQMSEESFLNCGLYNLGFLCLNRTGRVFEFLDWWMERLKNRCYNKLEKGWFVDQIWINFVPLYYEGVFIMRHPGHNMAYWNLHERTLYKRDEKYYVNEKFPLVFYHFSGYNAYKPGEISKYQNRFSFEIRPDLVSLFKDYTERVLQNNHEKFSQIPCHYAELQQANYLEYIKKNRMHIFRRKVKKKLRYLLRLND